MGFRTEHDALGSKPVPADAYWGIHTQRAVDNFPLSGRRVPFGLVRAIAMIKRAAAEANTELGYLKPELSRAIIAACDDIIAGKFQDQFPLDALQGGAGTSTNMNVNEVVANRAAELLGGGKGVYDLVDPIGHVNMHQSTNDVYASALRVAAIGALRDLSAAVAGLQGSLQGKEKEFAAIVKVGRTELQDAVPMTLGGEFGAWAEAVSRDRWRTFKCEERLRVVNLGGTAVGTGLGAPRDYIFLVIEKARALTGFGIARGENLLAETANADVFVEVSGILKAYAVNLVKITGDLRLMNYLGEIRLPPVQAGSSIMPGKVNPVIPEAVAQVGMAVMANDVLVAEAASRGSAQIVEFLPLLASALLESLEILANASRVLSSHVDAIAADGKRCGLYFDRSRAIVTAFVPEIGYERAGELLAEFDASGREDLRAFLAERLGGEMVGKTLAPQSLMSLGYRK